MAPKITKSLKAKLTRAGLPLLEQPKPLDFDEPHQKYYLANGEQVYGATTYTSLIPKDLFSWVASVTRRGYKYEDIKRSAGRVGTATHHHLHRRTTGVKGSESFSCTQEEANQINIATKNADDFWDEHKEKLFPIACEAQLVSEKHKFGGTLDLVAIDEEGSVVLIDYKTSGKIYDDFFYQQSAYVNLWAERYPSFPIDKVILVRIGKKKPKDVETDARLASSLNRYWDVFLKLLALGRELEAHKNERTK